MDALSSDRDMTMIQSIQSTRYEALNQPCPIVSSRVRIVVSNDGALLLLLAPLLAPLLAVEPRSRALLLVERDGSEDDDGCSISFMVMVELL